LAAEVAAILGDHDDVVAISASDTDRSRRA
jgi:hypothetical protein